MNSTSPKRKRLPHLPLETQHLPTHVFLEDGLDNVESPRTKMSKTLDTLDLDEPKEQRQPENIGHQRNINLSPHSELTKLADSSGDGPEPPTTQCQSPAPPNFTIQGRVKDSPSNDFNSAATHPTTPRSKSPPLTGEISDNFWHDSEITGHDPNDPNDDGYGINGIGFRPTSAIAWARSQRRKQQLAEFKNREAREARQQRSERRKRILSESDDGATTVDSSPRKSARVHFEDG